MPLAARRCFYFFFGLLRVAGFLLVSLGLFGWFYGFFSVCVCSYFDYLQFFGLEFYD